MAEGNPLDPAVIIAKCAMEGHTHACRQCGWTGMASDLKLGFARTGTPIRACPNCYYTDELVNFRVQEDDLNL